MVNHVEAPEQRDRMKHDVLKIDGEVEDQHTEDDSEQRGELKLIEETPSPFLDPESGTDQGGRKNQAYHKGVDEDQAEIADPSGLFRNG
jgi:hypothetical protein